MKNIVLYSYRRCPFAIRVRMVLVEKKIPFIVIEENLSELSDDLLRLHPEGKVPLLVHGETALHESSIITEYLDEAFPENLLMPQDPLLRAKVRLWTYWCNEMFKPDLDAFKYEWKHFNEEQKAALTDRLKNHLEKLEEALSKNQFLLGEKFTLADIHVFPFYRQLTKANPVFESLFQTVHANRWLAEITARPSFERVMEKLG